jgi:hypothetical protein
MSARLNSNSVATVASQDSSVQSTATAEKPNSSKSSAETDSSKTNSSKSYTSQSSESSNSDNSVSGNRYYSFSDQDLRVDSVAYSADDCVEAVVVIGGVLDDADGAVRFSQGVLSLDYISDADFSLLLPVSSSVILDSIFELVMGRGLKLVLADADWYQKYLHVSLRLRGRLRPLQLLPDPLLLLRDLLLILQDLLQRRRRILQRLLRRWRCRLRRPKR